MAKMEDTWYDEEARAELFAELKRTKDPGERERIKKLLELNNQNETFNSTTSKRN